MLLRVSGRTGSVTLLLRVILVVAFSAIVLAIAYVVVTDPGSGTDVIARGHRPPVQADRGPAVNAGPRARRDGIGAGRPVGGAAASNRPARRAGADRHQHRQAGARLPDQDPAAGDRRRTGRDLGAGHGAERTTWPHCFGSIRPAAASSTACSWPSSRHAPPRSSPTATRSRPPTASGCRCSTGSCTSTDRARWPTGRCS